ncbi:MAG: flagellar hook basal-body protein [Candidatus Binataceae bacterium]
MSSINGLYIAASGLSASMAELDQAGFNLANASTPGFKRFEELTQTLGSRTSPFKYASVPLGPVLSMQSGSAAHTGNPLDVYLTGQAFMAVQKPDGGEAYTRDGQLSEQAAAQPGFVTLYAASMPLLDSNGTPFMLPPGDISIAQDGTVSVAGAPYGQIKLADSTGQHLIPMGDLLYATASGQPLPADPSAGVIQGAMEVGASESITDMMSVLKIGQRYQNLMSAIHDIENNMSQAIKTYSLNA